MKRWHFALIALALSVLACSQVGEVPTLTPTVTASPVPSLTPAARPTAQATEAVTAIVRQATVNLRDAPNGKVIGQLSAGDTVVVVTRDGDWVKIQNPAGWVWVGCLELNTKKGCQAK